LFADKLLIIDEAQNLRDAALTAGAAAASKEEAEEETTPTKVSDAAGGKKLTPVLLDVLRYAEGLKLVLMTATPMYDTASEIVLLLNLLLLNDTKRDDALLNARTLFPTGELTKDKAQVDSLIRVVKRYVSYMRGENPATFPLRLTPPAARPRPPSTRERTRAAVPRRPTSSPLSRRRPRSRRCAPAPRSTRPCAPTAASSTNPPT
jgi:hypothetical protein